MQQKFSNENIFTKILFKISRIIKRLVFLANVSYRIFKTMGPRIFLQKLKGFVFTRLRPGIKVVDLNSEYDVWIKKTKLKDSQIKQKIENIKTFELKPKISIIMPVYNVEERWLRLAIESVKGQIYENWELCIADDASTQAHIRPLLEEYMQSDPRIQVKFLDQNQHISGASNACIELATGDFVALMDNDDEIESYALYEFVKIYNEKNGNLDFVYSDEDQIGIDGKRINPILKPDWSPETTLSMMYTTHLGFYRTEIVREIGGFRKGLEGSQDYDLVLRFTEKTTLDRIYHIPQILYHWRRIPGSTAEDYDSKPYAKLASAKALQDTIARRQIDASVYPGYSSPSFHIKRKILGNPLVSIIIPTKNKSDYVKRCIESIEANTTTNGFRYEIILVDNNSDEKESLDYFETLKSKHTVLKYEKPFNYSAINNFAAANCSGEFLLFLNNDTAVINDEWLYELLQIAQEREIGVVGARLLFPNDTIQHAGVYLHKDGIGGHIFRGFWRDANGYMDRILITSNVSAVTGACMMVKRSIFNEVKGLNEEHLAVAFNDVDFCLKVKNAGYRNIYQPFAILYHYESITRGPEDNPEKIKRFNKEWDYMMETWKDELKGDKYWNPNLVLNNGVLSLNFDINS
jgi:glycosyltransferase involved in cell wall biosynthesis